MSVGVELGLGDLLAPLSVQEFLTHTWESRSLYVEGQRERFRQLMTLDELRRLVREAERLVNPPISLVAGYKNAAGEHREMSAQLSQFDALLELGATVFVKGVDRVSAPVARLVRRLTTELGVSNGFEAGVFVSGAAAGFGLHCDVGSVLSMHLEGAKRWWIGEGPAIPHPLYAVIPTLQQQAEGAFGFDERGLREVVMSPGDVLYLPPGTWHKLRSDGLSMHLSMVVTPRPRPIDLISSALEARLLKHERWRVMPMMAAGSPEVARAAIEASLAQRLADVRQALDSLTPAELFDAWRARVDRPIEDEAERAEPSPVSPDDTLAFVDLAAFTFVIDPARDAGESCVLFQGGRSVATLPAQAFGMLRTLQHHPRFAAKEAAQWLPSVSWRGLSALLLGLLDAGVLRREPRAG